MAFPGLTMSNRSIAANYDAQVEGELGFAAVARTADRLAEKLAETAAQKGPILDVGCGTGLAGLRLDALGFGPIDGLDLTPEMLEQARRRGVYRKLIEADVMTALPFDDAVYEAVIATGVFTLGHVDATPMNEIVRLMRPGAWFAASIHRDVYAEGGFERAIDRLVGDGRIDDLEVVPAPLFDGEDDTGRYTFFRRTGA